MNDPDVISDLDGIHRPESVSPMSQHDLENARTHPFHRFSSVRLLTRCGYVERLGDLSLDRDRKAQHGFLGGPDP